MTNELKREFEKLEEIEVRYHQALDMYRAHIHQDAVSKWQADEDAYQKVAAEWQAQMDKIRAIMDGNTATEDEQSMDDLKEQTEDEFVLEEQEEPENVPRLKLCCQGLNTIIAICQSFNWQAEGLQDIELLMQFADNRDISLRDVAVVAYSINKHSTVGTLAEITEAVLRTLKAYYTD